MATHWGPIGERFIDDVAILDVPGGPLSLSDNHRRLLAAIHELIGRGWLKILLNLRDVQYMDSEGLQEIVEGYKATKILGGMLKLCGVAHRIRALLMETKIDRVISAFDSEGAALRSFSGSA